MFVPQHGAALWAWLIGGVLAAVAILFVLTLVPNKLRRPLIVGITFLAGLYYALEFFLPVVTDAKEGDKNFLTDWNKPFSDITTVLQAFAIGLGVYSLGGVHLRNVIRQRPGWGNSIALLAGMVLMSIAHIGKEAGGHPDLNKLDDLLYNGFLKSLDATMFSIIAFYIVSAAYRAFRIRSVEATIMLVSATVIMLGQVAIGQAVTNWIPNQGFAANFRAEIAAGWILKQVNSPALMAVNFGLGVGALATALRLWLSLERGSYFEEEL